MGQDQKVRRQIDVELAKDTPDFARIAQLSDSLADNEQNRLRFTVEASHINRLGLELVAKRETALSELIKNAYDADAANVEVDLTDFENEGGTLVIKDNGEGMSRRTLRDAWMRLSTPSKVDSNLSPLFKRPRAGRKGIGRFATQRLGKRLILETTIENEPFGHRLEFDWDSDFKSGRKLSDVWTELETFDAPRQDHGSTLTILGLRDRWTDASLRTVWKSILFLQPPFPIRSVAKQADKKQKDPGFHVVLNGGRKGGDDIRIALSDSLLQHSLAEISATIDAAGKAKVKLTSDTLSVDETIKLDAQFLLTGPVKLEARYFIYLSEVMPGKLVKTAVQLGREFGGIRIHRNSFRILPYGEGSNDWLELDRDTARRNLLPPGANANFFGFVSVNDQDNPLLEETSSREGLVENEAYLELAHFSRLALETCVLRIAEAREKKQKPSASQFQPLEAPRPSKAIDEGFNQLEDLFSNLEDNFSDDDARNSFKGALDDARRTASVAAAQFEQQTEEERARNIKYENMLRILASLGLSISVFGHEIKSATSLTSGSFTLLRDDLEVLDDSKAKNNLLATTDTLQSAVERVFDLGGYIETLTSFTGTRKLQPIAVRGSVKGFVEQFSSYLDRHGVKFDIDVVPKNLRTGPMHASEFDSILFNLLTNSIKAFQKAGIKSPAIRIHAKKDGDFIKLRFEDNGSEIPKDARDRIFDAFYTTTEFSRDEVAGPGTGLGLTIVSDIAANYGGEAKLIKASKGYITALEISLKTK